MRLVLVEIGLLQIVVDRIELVAGLRPGRPRARRAWSTRPVSSGLTKIMSASTQPWKPGSPSLVARRPARRPAPARPELPSLATTSCRPPFAKDQIEMHAKHLERHRAARACSNRLCQITAIMRGRDHDLRKSRQVLVAGSRRARWPSSIRARMPAKRRSRPPRGSRSRRLRGKRGPSATISRTDVAAPRGRRPPG